MKQQGHKAKKVSRNFLDYEESHHVHSKNKSTKQRKANNAIDKILRQRDFNLIKKMDDVY